MIDAVRNLSTTYRLSRHSVEGVTLRVYPPASEPISEGWYRMDQLPSWMIEAIALLDAAHPGEVEGLGRRIGVDTYWIEPAPRDTAGDRIGALLTEKNLIRSWVVAFAKATDENEETWREAVVAHEKTT